METHNSNSSATINWLKDFYQRFEAETNRLYERETFWRACQNCPDGHCCTRASYIASQRRLNPYLYEDWWLMLEYTRDRFSLEERKQLINNIKAPGPACIFLNNRRCMVHTARPWTSRIHPYTVCFRPNSRFFLPAVMEVPSCPALARRFDLKVDQLRVQDIVPITRDAESSLVQVKIRKSLPLWVIDASVYVDEWEAHIPMRKTLVDMQRLFSLAWEAGGENGEFLTLYVEKIFRSQEGVS